MCIPGGRKDRTVSLDVWDFFNEVVSMHMSTMHKRGRKAEAHHPANPACGRGFQRAHPPPCKGCERGSREGFTLLAQQVGTFYGTSNRKQPRDHTETTNQLHETDGG